MSRDRQEDAAGRDEFEQWHVCGAGVDRLGGVASRPPLLSLDEAACGSETLETVPPRPNNYGETLAVNRGRWQVDGEAFELELGPNNCAV